MQSLNAVLFDLDQTLLDRTTSLIKFLDWQFDVFDLQDVVVKTAWIERFIALDDNGKVWKDRVYASLISEFSIAQVNSQDLLKSYVHDFQKFATPFPHITQAIQTLKQEGYILGLISNGRSPFQEHNFQALGLASQFSCILVSEAIGLRKPDPAIFLQACQMLNLTPQCCVFVGDNECADIEGANAVGMRTIFFHPDPLV